MSYDDAMRDVALARERSFESAAAMQVSESESASDIQWREDKNGSFVRVSPPIQRDHMSSDQEYIPLPRNRTPNVGYSSVHPGPVHLSSQGGAFWKCGR